MEKWPNEPDTWNLSHARRTIQNLEMPVNSFSDKIMSRLDEQRRGNNKSKLMKKVFFITSAAAIMGVGIIGSALVSPAMAEALKGIPLVNSVVKLAEDLTGKTYTFNQTEPWSMGEDSGLVYKAEGTEYSQIMLNSNGEVKDILMDVKWSDLKDSYKKEMEAALQQLFPGQNTQVDTVGISVQYGLPADYPIKNGAVYLNTRVHNTFIELENGKLHRVVRSLANEEVDQAALKAAESIFAGDGLEGLRKGPLDNPSLVSQDGKEVYQLHFAASDKFPVGVVVEQGTNRIVKVVAGDLQDKIDEIPKVADKINGYSEAELLKNAMVQAKQLLKIDLEGYKATKDPKMMSVVYFTKNGAPTVVGLHNAKGQFYHLGFEEYDRIF
ncbi:DUF4179 domain-containing protein [Paenibacillus ehimensis]|uniref:DUF4179 domain-containing protein n=1 Tax=Paenibacillus ehimensis TaxID=79264 RepID=UPI002DBE0BDD|nr:DUF4179 domain-containing protein [Paenibacillus ehimensis]MEC0208138.1 DUF4179 domain-containing protein [Paenibacillus ehimensis]